MNTKRYTLSAFAILVVIGLVAFTLLNNRPNAIASTLSLPALSASKNEVLKSRILKAHLKATHGFSSIGALAELSRLYHANGFLSNATDCYEILIEQDPDNPKWPHYLARIISGYGMLDRAIELHRSAIELDPSYIPTRIQFANALLKSNRFEEAENAFNNVLFIDSNNAYALLGIARIQIERNDWTGAKALLKNAVAASLNQIGIDLLSTVHERLDERAAADQLRRDHSFGAYRDLADPWMDALFSDSYDTFALSTAAGMASFRGESANALKLLERAVSIEPSDPMLHFQLGGISQSAGEIDDALSHYQRSVQLKPDFSDGWHYIFQIQRDGGNAVAAQRTLEKGFKNCPSSPALLIEMADQMNRQGRFTKAVEMLRKSIELKPNEAQAYLNLGRLYITSGQVESGITAMKEALHAEPGNSLALTTLAFHAISSTDRPQADHYMARIRKQPKIKIEELQQLTSLYQTAFESNP